MEKYNYRRLNANATTTLQTGGGVVHSVTVGVAGASANTITLYDNTAASGTVIFNASTVVTLPCTWVLDAGFGTGLTCIIQTGTAADVTITYV